MRLEAFGLSSVTGRCSPALKGQSVNELREKIEMLWRNVQSVFLGKPDTVKRALTCLFSEGHLLIEDVPGVGKTTLARAIARSIDCSFKRIQFTPDLLPSDILGVSIYDEGTKEFVFKKGPIFANIVLADEINRTTPRTQSALLEGMNERQVSMDGRTWELPRPFMVIATQNPYDYEGTYPLPDSQLDRFFMRVEVGYPSHEDEMAVVFSQKVSHPLENLKPVLRAEDVVRIQQAVREVKVDSSIVDYILRIAEATRKSEELYIGVSPRGCLSLTRACQARAAIEGRDYCIPDDVKSLAESVLCHRMVRRTAVGSPSRRENADLIRRVLDELPVPV